MLKFNSILVIKCRNNLNSGAHYKRASLFSWLIRAIEFRHYTLKLTSNREILSISTMTIEQATYRPIQSRKKYHATS